MAESAYSKDEVKIKYEINGNGNPALVFVHCWCGNRNYWKNQTDFFSKKYTCINLDLAGHGESGNNRNKWTMQAFGEDVLAVIKQVNPDKMILIGHSLGGIAILTLAPEWKYKILGLIGIDTFSNIEFELSEVELEMFVQPYQNNFSRTIREYTSVLFPEDVDQSLKNKIIDDLSSANPAIAIESFKEFLRFRVTSAVKDLNLPVVCINSDRHPTRVEVLKRHIKNLDLKIMDNSGHFLMMENPKKFNKLLDESIDNILGQTA